MVSVASTFDVQPSLTYSQAQDGSQSLDLQESLSAAVVRQAADGSTHGTAVVVSFSLDARTGSATGSASQNQISASQTVLDKLKKELAQAKEFTKTFAAQRLQEAVKEIAITEVIGGRKGAEELVHLSRRISAAAQDYAAGERQLATVPTDATASDATASGATVLPSVAGTLGKIQQDPFYQLADAALGEISKALKKILPALEVAPDRKTRDFAHKLSDEFNRSVSDTLKSEQDFNAAAPAAQAYEQANGISPPDLSQSIPSLAGADVSSESVNLTV
jgi:hypothetical protein